MWIHISFSTNLHHMNCSSMCCFHLLSYLRHLSILIRTTHCFEEPNSFPLYDCSILSVPSTHFELYAFFPIRKNVAKDILLHKSLYIYKNNCIIFSAAAAKSLQSCPTLCDPIDGSPPGSPVPGILQARTLEWVAISFSNAWKWKVKGKSLSRVRLLATPWTAACQAPPSMGFSRQDYWSGMPSPSRIFLGKYG